jgi:hypothetical protein
MTVADEVKKRYGEYIKLQVLDEQYLSRDRERKILGEGVTRFEIPLENARSILMSVASESDIVFEKDVDKLVKEIMQVFAANSGNIGPNEFAHGIAIYRQLSSGHVSELDAKRRLKQMVIENDWKPGRAFFSLPIGTRKWFKEIP